MSEDLSSEIQVAWAAGLFEGEGCFTYSGNGSFLTLFLESTDLDVVERFHSVIGFGRVIHRPLRPGKRKPSYRWQAYGRINFAATLSLFSPYLGQRRLARAYDLLEADTARRAEAASIVREVLKGGAPTTPVDPGSTLLGPLAAGSLVVPVSSW